MKLFLFGFILLGFTSLNAQNYYANIIDFFTLDRRIEIYDTTQTLPRIQILDSPTSKVFDARVTKDGYFAYRGGIEGVSDAYYFLDESFAVTDSLVHQKSGLNFESIDDHCVYRDDSLVIYILQRAIPLSTPVYLNDYGNVHYLLDNIIIAVLNGQIVLEFSNHANFSPKYIEVYVVDSTPTWDVAHVNSVDWDGSGIIVSNLFYGIYKIDLEGQILWEQDSLHFTDRKPTRQHDLQYLGDGLYSVFSDGDNSNEIFAATFRIENDSVKYDFMHLPRLSASSGMGNFQYNGIINYGAHQSKFVFPDTSMHHNLKPNEYAYRAELHSFNIVADISHHGDSLVYTPLNEYSTFTWSTGDIGNIINYTADTVSVTEITPDGFVVYTERYFSPVQGLEQLSRKADEPNGPSYNLQGQPVAPKGLYIRNGKVFLTPH